MPVRILNFAGKDFENDPFLQFVKWFNERSIPVYEESGSVVLSTASAGGRPSARVVLVKEFSSRGFIFYTNYGSRKAEQISENPSGALLFNWPEVHRQIRIEGRIEKISESESIRYFRHRKRESQLSAWASEQSRPVTGRNYLESRMDTYKIMFRDQPVPKPPGWGGFILIPDWYEFWQEGKHRLHDRISYSLVAEGWRIQRLAP
jgi:pyridoxamine 5'-phosphate oxidase